jgi:hypothetical protein
MTSSQPFDIPFRDTSETFTDAIDECQPKHREVTECVLELATTSIHRLIRDKWVDEVTVVLHDMNRPRGFVHTPGQIDSGRFSHRLGADE